MLKEVFDIEKFNLFQDEENYYFFRALNMGDLFDIENNITVKNGEIMRIRTDLERYQDTPMYSSSSLISLKEVFDHIKIHHRIDTNCISLTSNANVAILYGRAYYKDQYVMVKVPKKELGTKVYNAGLYMMEEIQKRIDVFIENNQVDEMTKYYLSLIEHTMTEEKLDEIIQALQIKSPFENNQCCKEENETNVHYQDLTIEQTLEKNKMIAKIQILNKNILSDVDNNQLIQTLEMAFSSLEFIHYKEIKKEEIIEVSKEMIDYLALLQQKPRESFVEKLKEEVIKKIIEKKD